jgi:hypothetical protein
MHDSLKQIPSLILEVACGALTQANTHAAFFDPGMEHWGYMSVLNTALAGELFIKAIIAREHPLLIFKDLFHLYDEQGDEMNIKKIIRSGRTYSFEHLPKLLWVAAGERLPDMNNFEKIRQLRNAIQHFCIPENITFLEMKKVSTHFIYNNIDPLIEKHFGLYAIEYCEDQVGYDYLVQYLIGSQVLFSIPDDFGISEIDVEKILSKTSAAYQVEFNKRLTKRGIKNFGRG